MQISFYESIESANIWNVTDITDYSSSEGVSVTSDVDIAPGESYSFGMIINGTDSVPTSPQTVNLVMYRVYGGTASFNGHFYSFTPQYGGLQSQLDLALVPSWGNTCEYCSSVTIPAGTIVYFGTVAPQPIYSDQGYIIGFLQGGGSQVYIP